MARFLVTFFNIFVPVVSGLKTRLIEPDFEASGVQTLVHRPA
jgi:hypothetical protein